MRLARADIEESVGARLGNEIESHLDGVLDVEKVSPLFAIGELGPVTLEQADPPRLDDLPEGLVHHAPHVSLVILVRPEHVEVFQADDAVEITAS